MGADQDVEQSPIPMPQTTPDLHRWSPALRRAVMALRPDFFAWPLAKRERFAAHLSRADRAALDRMLLAELFGITAATDHDAEVAIDELELDQCNLMNATVQPLFGIGKDSFFLNEHFTEGDSLLNYETVADWDRANFDFQERARREEDPEYAGRPYLGYLYGGWARLFVDDRFTYATLSMAAAHVHAQVESCAEDLIDGLIPHRYVPGSEHGKRVSGGYQWDMRADAGGREAALAELRRCCYAYLGERHEALACSWDEQRLGAVYLVERSEGGEHALDVIFTDRTTLRAVRFRSFLDDCRRLERPATELEPQVEVEKAAAGVFLRGALEDIEANLDPAIVPLRKKRKVVIAPEAADFLLDLDEEE